MKDVFDASPPHGVTMRFFPHRKKEERHLADTRQAYGILCKEGLKAKKGIMDSYNEYHINILIFKNK